MTATQLTYQIKAIKKLIEQGKVKNVYSALGKIKQLEYRLKMVNERERVSNWLGQ